MLNLSSKYGHCLGVSVSGVSLYVEYRTAQYRYVLDLTVLSVLCEAAELHAE